MKSILSFGETLRFSISTALKIDPILRSGARGRTMDQSLESYKHLLF
jgi:hypothetical protein